MSGSAGGLQAWKTTRLWQWRVLATACLPPTTRPPAWRQGWRVAGSRLLGWLSLVPPPLARARKGHRTLFSDKAFDNELAG